MQCEDMMILMEMEQNGLPFDEELCDKRSKELDSEIESLKAELKAIYPNVPINFGSNDHLSAFLYGGIVKEDGKEFVGYFKTGARAGEPKHKNIVIEHCLPRLYTPLKGSDMAKAGNYATDEGTLRKLKGKRGVLDKILHLSKLEKLNGTYYNGLVKLRKEMNWEPNVLHGQFNQTTAISGRLSSSKPNLQNFASDLQDIFISKYND
jgi:DNA polymerase I-like protein with 3'-5' exonuclease and polymerase domains